MGERVSERQVEALVDSAKGGGEGKRGVDSDFVGKCLAARQKFGSGNHLIDQADAVGLFGVDLGSGEQHSEGRTTADQARETLRAAVTGQDAELYLGLAEVGVFRGNAQGAGHGEFTAAAEGEAADARDDRFAAGLNKAQDGLAAQREGLGIGWGKGCQLAYVGPGGESTVTGAGEQDDTEVGVGGKGTKGMVEFSKRGYTEGVEDLGPVDGDDSKRRATIEAKVSVFHARKVSREMRFVTARAGAAT